MQKLRIAIYACLGLMALVWALKFRADLEDDRYLSAASDYHAANYLDLLRSHYHDYWRKEGHHRDDD